MAGRKYKWAVTRMVGGEGTRVMHRLLSSAPSCPLHINCASLAHLQSSYIRLSRYIVFLLRLQEIRRHLAPSLVSLVGWQWWWWWGAMRRAGQHQGGRRTNLYLYLDFHLYLYFHVYLSIWWWATTHAGRRSLFQQLSIFPSVNPQPALHMTGFVVFFLQDLVFVKYMIEYHDMITTILGCTSARFDIYLGYLCFHSQFGQNHCNPTTYTP